jgi:hypothetical protein
MNKCARTFTMAPYRRFNLSLARYGYCEPNTEELRKFIYMLNMALSVAEELRIWSAGQ